MTELLQSVDVEQALARSGHDPVFAILSGPSGVGKDTVLDELERVHPGYVRVATCTTRAPRAGEIPDKHYRFVDEDTFQRLIDDGELIEHEHIYGSHWSGVPRSLIANGLAAGQDVIMRVDVAGALKFRSLVPGVVLIFLTAPSREVQVRWLSQRKTDTPNALARRIARADDELQQLDRFDYLVVNHEGDPAFAAETIQAILRAERHRIGRTSIMLP